MIFQSGNLRELLSILEKLAIALYLDSATVTEAVVLPLYDLLASATVTTAWTPLKRTVCDSKDAIYV